MARDTTRMSLRRLERQRASEGLELEDLRRDNFDPGDILASFSGGGDFVVDTTVCGIDTVAGGMGVRISIPRLHMSLPEIHKGVDQEEGREGGEDKFSNYMISTVNSRDAKYIHSLKVFCP